MKLNSKRVDLEYQPGEELSVFPNDTGLPFYFDVEDELTEDKKAMNIVGRMLDKTDEFEAEAKKVLKKALSDQKNEFHDTVTRFMEFHRDDVEPETVEKLFPGKDRSFLSFTEMVDYLRLVRFGSLVHYDTGKQAFVIELNFNPDITNELLVIYFNLKMKVIEITHES